MVPPSSNRISRVPLYLICLSKRFEYGIVTLYDSPFQVIPLRLNSSAPPRSLAATGGISFDVFSSGYWDVSLLPVRFVLVTILAFWQVGFPIQISPDHRILPPPRRFSQAVTSFFASDCQGIHRVHLFTWLYNPNRSYVVSNVHLCLRLIQFSLLGYKANFLYRYVQSSL